MEKNYLIGKAFDVRDDLVFLRKEIKKDPIEILIRYRVFIFFIIILIIILWSNNGFFCREIDFMLIISIFSAILVYYQIRVQSTVTKLQPLFSSPTTSKCISECMLLIDGKTEKKICVSDIESDVNCYSSVTFVLGLCDDIGTAVKENIVSSRIVWGSQGKFILKVYYGLKPYIDELAKENQGSYQGIEYLSEKWEGKYKRMNSENTFPNIS